MERRGCPRHLHCASSVTVGELCDNWSGGSLLILVDAYASQSARASASVALSTTILVIPIPSLVCGLSTFPSAIPCHPQCRLAGKGPQMIQCPATQAGAGGIELGGDTRSLLGRQLLSFDQRVRNKGSECSEKVKGANPG